MSSSSGRSGRETKATLAQLAERLTRNEKVDSSILSSGSFLCGPCKGRVCFKREWRNGSRAGFRFLCLRTCGFESHLAHKYRPRHQHRHGKAPALIPSRGMRAGANQNHLDDAGAVDQGQFHIRHARSRNSMLGREPANAGGKGANDHVHGHPLLFLIHCCS